MIRNGPFRREFAIPLQAIHTELNRLFDEYWTPKEVTPTPSEATYRPAAAQEAPGAWSPPADLIETADAFYATVEIPGVEPSTIELSVTGNVLSLKGTKPLETPAAPNSSLLERKFGPFFRQIVLPSEVEFEGTEAEARHGVLRIKLPKQEVPKPRTIPVQAG